MLTCRIELTGKTTDELLLALEQVQKQIDEGHGSGVNYVNGEAGYYSFKLNGEEVKTRCLSCDYIGGSDDFAAGEADPSTAFCPECSGTDLFIED